MEKAISADGTPVAFERSGAGPNLVLVHGSVADRTRWAPVRPRLDETFTVIAVDRRGRGGSGDSADYEFAREFEDVAAVVDALEPPVLLFGHSFGAMCALEAALGQRLAGLILYEPPIFEGGGTPPELVAKIEAQLAAGDREGAVTTFARDVIGLSPASFSGFRSSPAWPARVAAAHTMPRELHAADAYRFDAARIGAIRVPVLLLRGSDSKPAFGQVMERLKGALPHARTAVMPGQRHNAMDTAPDLVVDAVVDFWHAIG